MGDLLKFPGNKPKEISSSETDNVTDLIAHKKSKGIKINPAPEGTEAVILHYPFDKSKKEKTTNVDVLLSWFEKNRSEFKRYYGSGKESFAVFYDFWMDEKFGLSKQDCVDIKSEAIRKDDANLGEFMTRIIDGWPE